MKNAVVSHMKKLEMRLKKTWILKILQDITDLQDDIIVPIIIEEYKEQV